MAAEDFSFENNKILGTPAAKKVWTPGPRLWHAREGISFWDSDTRQDQRPSRFWGINVSRVPSHKLSKSRLPRSHRYRMKTLTRTTQRMRVPEEPLLSPAIFQVLSTSRLRRPCRMPPRSFDPHSEHGHKYPASSFAAVRLAEPRYRVVALSPWMVKPFGAFRSSVLRIPLSREVVLAVSMASPDQESSLASLNSNGPRKFWLKSKPTARAASTKAVPQTLLLRPLMGATRISAAPGYSSCDPRARSC